MHFLPHSRCSTLNFQFCENMVQLLFFSFVIVHFPLSLLKCLLPSHLSGKMLCFHQETAQTQSLFCSYFHTSPSSSFLCPELIINPSFSLCLRYLYHKTHNAILSWSFSVFPSLKFKFSNTQHSSVALYSSFHHFCQS